MLTIHKYDLKIQHGPFTIEMPADHQFLSAAYQGKGIVAWFFVNTSDFNTASVLLELFGTRWELPLDINNRRFLTTISSPDKLSVWHLFSGKEESE